MTVNKGSVNGTFVGPAFSLIIINDCKYMIIIMICKLRFKRWTLEKIRPEKIRKRLFQSFFSPIYIPTNRRAPFFAYKHLQPTIHPNRSDEGLNARNVSFKTLYSGQFTLSTQFIILNYVYPIILSHKRNTTVSLETYSLHYCNGCYHGQLWCSLVNVNIQTDFWIDI